MTSTFHGLEVSRRGMTTQQAALSITGHNIANANTPGYTRQRVNFNQTEPYPAPSRNRPQIPGQMGTGVEAGSIQRIRDSFLDTQFRTENNKVGYWGARSEALTKMEDIMNEPTEDGLAQTINEFWGALQDLSTQPEDSGARSVVRQRALAVADTFNYLSSSLSTIQEDYKVQLDVTVDSVNSILKQISDVNKLIGETEPHGYIPNDLYDERDRLVEQLSSIVNIRVETKESGGRPDPIAEGLYDIYMVDENGNDLVKLIDSTSSDGTPAQTLQLRYQVDPSDDYRPITRFEFLDLSDVVNPDDINDAANGTPVNTISASNFNCNGEIRALMEAYGYSNASGQATGIYTEMLKDLDSMAFLFVGKFNEIHQVGFTLPTLNPDGTIATPAKNGINFFEPFATLTAAKPYGAARSMKLSVDIKNDLNNIAASIDGKPGDGTNATNLSNIKNKQLDFNNDGTDDKSIDSFYQSKIGQMGVDAQLAERMTNNSKTLKTSVETKRSSVSSVSLDEEMTNMIQFQHAYNASARILTVVDEMLDKIINGMGVVGR